MISLLADRIDSSSAALQGVGKSAKGTSASTPSTETESCRCSRMGYESKEFALSDLIFDSPLSFCAFLIGIRLNGISLFYLVLSYSKELFNAE